MKNTRASGCSSRGSEKWNEYYLNVLSGRFERAEGMIQELDGKWVIVVRSEEQRVKRCPKVNSTSGAYGTISGGLLCVSVESQNQKEAERTHLRQTYTRGNANGYHSGIREMILKCKNQPRDPIILKQQQQKISWSRKKIFQASSPNNIQGNQRHSLQRYTLKSF